MDIHVRIWISSGYPCPNMDWVLKHCQARVGRPNQEDFKLGCPRCCCTEPGIGLRSGLVRLRTGPSGPPASQSYSPGPRIRSCAGSYSPKHWHVQDVPIRKTSSWAAPAAVAQYRAAASGQGHRALWPFNHDRTHRSTGTCGPSQSGRLQVGRPPLLLHSHGTGPRPGTGQSHRAGGPFKLYIPRSRSLAGSDSVTEALARTVPVRKTSSWAAPLLRLLHRTGPPQDRAIGPADHYTVRGHGPGQHHDQTHRSPGARGPSQSG